MSEEYTTIAVGDPKLFFYDVLSEAGQNALYEWADEERLIGQVHQAFQEMTHLAGGSIETDSSTREGETPFEAKHILGQYHINLPKAAVSLLKGGIIIVIDILKAYHDSSSAINVPFSITTALQDLAKHVQKLTPSEVQVYLAIQRLTKSLNKEGVSAEEIKQYLKETLPEELAAKEGSLAYSLGNLSGRGVLQRTGELYSTV